MYRDAGRPRSDRWLLGAGALLVVVVVVAGGYALGTAAGPGSVADGARGKAAAQGPAEVVLLPLPGAVASEDPVESALAWLRAARTQRFDDAPTAWIDRVLPVVTARLAQEYESYREGSVGADWAEFVQDRCTATVEEAGGVVPEEAPRSPSTVSVQVAGSLLTRCDRKDAAPRPTEHLAATLELIRQADGRWRVNERPQVY